MLYILIYYCVFPSIHFSFFRPLALHPFLWCLLPASVFCLRIISLIATFFGFWKKGENDLARGLKHHQQADLSYKNDWLIDWLIDWQWLIEWAVTSIGTKKKREGSEGYPRFAPIGSRKTIPIQLQSSSSSFYQNQHVSPNTAPCINLHDMLQCPRWVSPKADNWRMQQQWMDLRSALALPAVAQKRRNKNSCPHWNQNTHYTAHDHTNLPIIV